jgi:hypothetical protein
MVELTSGAVVPGVAPVQADISVMASIMMIVSASHSMFFFIIII